MQYWAEKWDTIKEAVSRKLYYQENSMLKWLPEQLDIINWIGKYFLMEKMDFC